MQFYMLIALLATYIKKCNVLKVIIPTLIITYGWRLFVVHHSNTGSPQDVFMFFVWATQLPGMLDEFLVGYLVARFVRSDYATNFFAYKYTPLILFIASALMLFLMFHIYLNNSAFWPIPWMVIFFRTYMALTFGVLILFLCALKINKKIRMALTPFYYGGTISYGIYLWHLPVLMSVKEKLSWLSPLQSLFVIVVFTLVLSSLSWHFIEKKFLVRKV